MQIYEFTNIDKAGAFMQEAKTYGRAKWIGLVCGWSPDTWQVAVSAEFYAIVEARKNSPVCQ